MVAPIQLRVAAPKKAKSEASAPAGQCRTAWVTGESTLLLVADVKRNRMYYGEVASLVSLAIAVH